VILPIVALLGQAPPPVTLTYFEEHFIVRDGAFNESAPLKLPPENPKLSTLFRRNNTFAVWDERGLTVRVGAKIKSTKLPDIATSPKVFSKKEILETAAEIKRGRRTRNVSGLSGALRIGSKVYFLGRWETKEGKPWAEALVQVDLSQPFPEPKLVGRARVSSMADKAIDTQLFILDGRVTYVAKQGNRWGIEQLDPSTNRLTFDQLGASLEAFDAVGSRQGYFVEKTSYGTTIAGRISFADRTRKIVAESRCRMRFLDTGDPGCVVLSFGDTAMILDGGTGAVTALPVPCSARRLTRGIVVWTPVAEPKRAWLYDPARWKLLAQWP
jgi:hypothetical protein